MKRRLVTIEAPKTGTVRMVPLDDTAHAILRKLRGGTARIGYVFLYHGESMQRMNNAFSSAVKRAGIKYITVEQCCRHTFGSRLARQGVPVHEIAKMMGHSSITTTERYLHSTDERLREAVRKLPQKIWH